MLQAKTTKNTAKMPLLAVSFTFYELYDDFLNFS